MSSQPQNTVPQTEFDDGQDARTRFFGLGQETAESGEEIEHEHDARPQSSEGHKPDEAKKKATRFGIGRFGGRGRKTANAVPAPKPAKATKTGPSAGARLVKGLDKGLNAVGRTVRATLLAFHRWTTGVVAVLFVLYVWLEPQPTRVQLMQGVLLGVVVTFVVLWMALAMLNQHRKPGPMTSIVALVLFAVMVAIVGAIAYRRPEWYPGVAAALTATLVFAGWVHHREEMVTSQQHAQAWEAEKQAFRESVEAALKQQYATAFAGAATTLKQSATTLGQNLGAAAQLRDQMSVDADKIRAAVTEADGLVEKSHEATTSILATSKEQEDEIERRATRKKEDATSRLFEDSKKRSAQWHLNEVNAAREAVRHEERGRAAEAAREAEAAYQQQLEAREEQIRSQQQQIVQLQQQVTEAASDARMQSQRPTSPTAMPTLYVDETGGVADTPSWDRS